MNQNTRFTTTVALGTVVFKTLVNAVRISAVVSYSRGSSLDPSLSALVVFSKTSAIFCCKSLDANTVNCPLTVSAPILAVGNSDVSTNRVIATFAGAT